MDILEILGVQKKFGTHEVLKGVNLNVPKHSVFGFIGQNGAGKTTTMKIILGLLKADEGSVYVCGEQVKYGQTETNRKIGYLPDVPEFYPYMTAMEYLHLCGEVTGMDKGSIVSRSEELLELAGLTEYRKKRIGGYSRGMKQRLGIAQALLNRPELLICDEPTSALDPIGRKEILGILSKVREHTTVLFSTHILSDVERICDDAAILKDGVIAVKSAMERLRGASAKGICLEFRQQEELNRFLDLYGDQPSVEKTDATTVVIRTAETDCAEQRVLEILSGSRILPQKMELMEPTLESLFMEVVQ